MLSLFAVTPLGAPAEPAASFYNDVWSSGDGVHWTQHAAAPWSKPDARGMICGSVVFQDRVWVIGGGTYWTDRPPQLGVGSIEEWTFDGTNWSQVPQSAPWSPARRYHDVVAFEGRLWLMAGVQDDARPFGAAALNDVWSSPDGSRWTQVTAGAPWAARYAAAAAAFNDAIWLVGGTSSQGPMNDVWEYAPQPDATHAWRQVYQNGKAPFAGRDGAGLVVFVDPADQVPKLWLLGGWNPRVFPKRTSNEVWKMSPDGRWSQVKPNTFVDGQFDPASDWEGRHMAGWVAFQGRIWIVGGDNSQGHYQSDVWSSADGVTWTRVTANAPWSPRVLHYTVVFQDQIWVVGGQTLPQFVEGAQ